MNDARMQQQPVGSNFNESVSIDSSRDDNHSAVGSLITPSRRSGKSRRSHGDHSSRHASRHRASSSRDVNPPSSASQLPSITASVNAGSSLLFGGHSSGLERDIFTSGMTNSGKAYVVSQDFPPVTEEDRFHAYLGYKDLNKMTVCIETDLETKITTVITSNEIDAAGKTATASTNVGASNSSSNSSCGISGRSNGIGGGVTVRRELIVYREEFCGACGIIHQQPSLLDIYHECKSCHNVIRDPVSLRQQYKSLPMSDPLEFLFATYGDPFDPLLAREVTDQCNALVRLSNLHDRVAFKPMMRMDQVFGYDPDPRRNKQLRARYRMSGGSHGTLVLDFDPSNRIPVTFLLMVPKKRYLKVFSALYGHPKGATVTGRMSYDVTEIVQSLVDQNGGCFLNISAHTPLRRLFGDPCPGYPKDLRVSFEVSGRGGAVQYSEIRGHLRKPIFIEVSPTIAPLIWVSTATYGLTPTARRDRLDFLNKQLKQIQLIEHRVREGIPVQPDEIVLLRKKKRLSAQRDLFITLPAVFLDVSEKLQRMADKGGVELLLDRKTFDPNAVFGNPAPGVPKILEVSLDCQGHDAERLTETNEMMDTGHSRNFITVKKARFNILVEDADTTTAATDCDWGEPVHTATTTTAAATTTAVTTTAAATTTATNTTAAAGRGARGVMSESLRFRTDNAHPVIIVTCATYGEIESRDMSKIIDVTFDMQRQVKGRKLIVGSEVNLNRLFRMDPSPGKRKQLRIEYLTRGFTGNIRVREKNDCLVAGIELGYPPMPPPDDDNYVFD